MAQDGWHRTTALVLFDGVCTFCNGSVLFIVDRDPASYFQFAPLQQPGIAELLAEHGITLPSPPDTIYLLEDGKLYSHSTAGLRIARKLKGLWKLFYVFIVVPAFIRNAVYRFIAQRRYRWFGKEETCRVPTPALKSRMFVPG